MLFTANSSYKLRGLNEATLRGLAFHARIVNERVVGYEHAAKCCPFRFGPRTYRLLCEHFVEFFATLSLDQMLEHKIIANVSQLNPNRIAGVAKIHLIMCVPNSSAIEHFL